MKKHLIASLIALTLASFAASPAFALKASCDTEFYAAQNTVGQALMARDRAELNQYLRQPESSLKLVCLDQALAVAAKAGLIFSDVVPSTAPDWDASIAVGLGQIYHTPDTNNDLAASRTEQDKGEGDNLMRDLRDVLDTVVTQHVSNYPDSMSGMILSDFTDIADDVLSSWSGYPDYVGDVSGVNYACSNPDILWNLVTGEGSDPAVAYVDFLDLLNGTAPAGVGTDYTNTFTAENALFSNALNAFNELIPGGIDSWKVPPTIPAQPKITDVISAM
jgi:hypothetical protein